MNADPAKLYSEEIGADYIAVIKNPRYMEAPEYINPETRQQFLYDNGLRFLRQYQINALKALQETVRHGNQRFLFEMATGTGKTLTSAAVIRLFLRSGNANRVLSWWIESSLKIRLRKTSRITLLLTITQLSSRRM